jgi:sarcosine oxidase
MHDVIVLGLGVTGSAIAGEAARRGMRVMALDRYAPPHANGSSHGESRIIREAYFEHPAYVPMVQRAYDLWRELETASGKTLLSQTGGLMIGAPDSVLVTGARRSADQHGLRHEMLTAAEVTERFPAMSPEPGMVAVWEPRAGILHAEACVDALLSRAQRYGADLHFDEPAQAWRMDEERVCVNSRDAEYFARRLVIAAGPWVGSLVPELQPKLRIERQVVFWFDCAANEAAFANRCPIHIWQYDEGRFFYGFPDLGNGVKLGFHHDGATTTADTVSRVVEPGEVEHVREVARRFVSGAEGALRSAVVCLYTNTRDEHFLIDRHPAHAQVLVASACSGHGFKFAPAIGEIVADMIEERPPKFEVELFRWR